MKKLDLKPSLRNVLSEATSVLLYKYSLRFDYSCDVVKKCMINELACVGREPLNGRMLTGKGYASLCQGPVPCTLIPAIRRSNNVQVYKCCRKEIYTISAAWNFFLPIVVKHWQIGYDLTLQDKTISMAKAMISGS